MSLIVFCTKSGFFLMSAVSGFGRFNNVCGAYAEWTMDDNGEPGVADQIIAMRITDASGSVVLNLNPGELGVDNTVISGSGGAPLDDMMPWLDLEQGNHQWTPHPFKDNGPTQTTPCPEVTPMDP